MKTFPIQRDDKYDHMGRHKDIPGIQIPWEVAEVAYRAYSRKYGTMQSLERLAERGGFGRDELFMLLEWEAKQS